MSLFEAIEAGFNRVERWQDNRARKRLEGLNLKLAREKVTSEIQLERLDVKRQVVEAEAVLSQARLKEWKIKKEIEELGGHTEMATLKQVGRKMGGSIWKYLTTKPKD